MIVIAIVILVDFMCFAPAHLNQGGGGLVIMSVPPVQDFPLPGLHSHMTGSVATPEQGQRLDIMKYIHEMKNLNEKISNIE